MMIGARLHELREQKKMSQGELEKRTGLSRFYISRVEHGFTVPGLGTLEKLAYGLKVPLFELVYEGEDPPKAPNIPKDKSSSAQLWGRTTKEARMLQQFRQLFGQMEEGKRRLLLHMAQKMANRKAK